MRNSGRVNLFALFAVVAVVMIAIVVFFSKSSPGTAGGAFMDALVRGDVNELTNLSYISNTDPSEIKKEWTFATQVAGKHYNFAWTITASTAQGDSGSVQLSVQRNFGTPGAYPENFALPMTMVNGQWKVDVANLSRELYPGLPKGTQS
jgi:hypothetical protein